MRLRHVQYGARRNLEVSFGRAFSNRDSSLNEIPKRICFYVLFMQKQSNVFKNVLQGVLGGIFGSRSTA